MPGSVKLFINILTSLLYSEISWIIPWVELRLILWGITPSDPGNALPWISLATLYRLADTRVCVAVKDCRSPFPASIYNLSTPLAPPPFKTYLFVSVS